MSENRSNKTKGRFAGFFSNPVVGIVGSIASVIGLFLAVYFYVESKETRQLLCYVNPVKAVVVKTGQASRLTASFDNKTIDTDITAAQVAIWNQGKQAIKRDNILKPIVIYTENNTPILEATLRKSSRDVTQLSLNTAELQQGRVSMSWSILEHNDGGVLQLIYAGDPNVKLRAEGIIEGQGSLEQLEFSGRITSPDEQYSSGSRAYKSAGRWALGIAAILFVFYILNKLIDRRRSKEREEIKKKLESPDEEERRQYTEKLSKDTDKLMRRLKIMDRIESLFGFLLFLLLCGIGIYFLLINETIPPFGFLVTLGRNLITACTRRPHLLTCSLQCK